MSTSQLLQHASLALLILGVGYLLYRAVDVLVRQWQSYRHIPYPTSDFDVGDDDGSKAVGAMVGIAVGDALGQFRESLPAWLARLRFGSGVGLSRGLFRMGRTRGAITDDTQLTLAVARSIGDDGEFDPAHFHDELAAWWSLRIGPGRATTRAVARLRAGDPDSGDHTSQGNGAAMRVTPLAVAFANDLAALQRSIEQSCRPTHAAPEAIAGAHIAGCVTLRCLEADADDDVASMLRRTQLVPESSQAPDRWRDALTRATQPSPDQTAITQTLRDLGTSGWVFESVPAAIHLLASAPQDWRRGLEALFAVGGDVDTIAALYCSWVGALHGPNIFGTLVSDIQGTALLAHEAHRITNQENATAESIPNGRSP